ncbi:RNA-directed DNA polymerase [Xanthomonas arboricola]|uniref:RNA-directed DNA polymerase n=1 Tax=Xanthomonas arboricola TaxID=56448 RepID=UPI0016194CCE|nr:RNA-directed DNA polymerase [Xanthomonas arboricola]MBB4598149.1 hypothetical protein [Xanthomonas arboricola]
MTVVDSRYKRLSARGSTLQDEVVLAQAWKKSHTYVRSFNWYADALELDVSAACLSNDIGRWAASIADGSYTTSPAWLVPAPKNGLWKFGQKSGSYWGPQLKDDAQAPVLRPLAHIGIREQTVATAVMLCLADCVESAQGDTSLPAQQARARGVYSYGNRLFCRWIGDASVARFSWGNSNTYSRYFQDYQRFIDRPVASAKQAEIENQQNVCIVSLDLSAFFDNITISALIDGLREEYDRFAAEDPELKPSDEVFWAMASKALSFQWREEDQDLHELFRDGKLPEGLPQGLVSSGFFANAYLLNFDRAMGREINRVTKSRTFMVLDYCRYVDDLRIVVTVPDTEGHTIDDDNLGNEIALWAQGILKKYTQLLGDKHNFLKINRDKTQVERLDGAGGDARTASQMKSLQQKLSGPFDLDTLQQVETGLNGLLSLAELSLIEEGSPLHSAPLKLASISKTKLELRDDTLTRFAAYRLVRSLRMRRSMTDLSDADDLQASMKSLEYDFQATAQRLISAWAVNPSLVQVLRYALDLCPSKDLLDPVAEALLSKINLESAASNYERYVAYYVLSQLFRAGATETGKAASRDATFQVADVEEYRSALSNLAIEVLSTEGVPWFAQQQGILLLAAVGRRSNFDLPGIELDQHRALQAFIKAEPQGSELPASESIVVSIIGHQLLADADHYFEWFAKFCSGRSRTYVSSAWKIIGEIDPNLFNSLQDSKNPKIKNILSWAPKHLSRYAAARWIDGNDELPKNKWLPLLKVVSHPSRPFDQENALLKLASGLLADFSVIHFDPEQLTPLNVQIRSDNWDRLNDPRFSNICVRAVSLVKSRDSAYRTPSWCPKDDAWMYALGRLLRSAATGEADFTTRHWLMREDANWYLGLRSTWQKRRTGMLHTAEALRGTMAAITPWFTDLLLFLLRWPGIGEADDSIFSDVRSRRELKRRIKARISEQSNIYGTSSGLPIYRYPVNWLMTSDRGLRVALVQGLMPLGDDFKGGIAALDLPGYRERHRRHTAAMLHLAGKHLNAREYVLGASEKPRIDLVVFPELSVHVDDQDLMRAFSDATGAMLFYGVLGAREPTTGSPVNVARWLVPQRRSGRRSWVEVDQGKFHLTPSEIGLGFSSWRPYQVVIELNDSNDLSKRPFRLTGSVCYDATDLALAADLRDESHMYVVAAMNKDVKTFDGMVAALRYHMYQHVIIANIGEYGGSTAQAPYDLEHRRLISHSHGAHQLSLSVFDVRLEDFGPKLEAAAAGVPQMKEVKQRIGKTPPAGLNRGL